MPSRQISSVSLHPRRKPHAISVAPKRKPYFCRRDVFTKKSTTVFAHIKTLSTASNALPSCCDQALRRMVEVYGSDSRGSPIIRRAVMSPYDFCIEKVLNATLALAALKVPFDGNAPDLFAEPFRMAAIKRKKSRPESDRGESNELTLDLSSLVISNLSMSNCTPLCYSESRSDPFNPFNCFVKSEKSFSAEDDPILQGSFLHDAMMSDERHRDYEVSDEPTSPKTSIVPKLHSNLESIPNRTNDFELAPDCIHKRKGCRSVPAKVIARKGRQSVPPKFWFASQSGVPKVGEWLVFGRMHNLVMYSIKREILGFKFSFKKPIRRSPRGK